MYKYKYTTYTKNSEEKKLFENVKCEELIL